MAMSRQLQRAGGRPGALGREIVRRVDGDRLRGIVKVRGGVGKQLLLEHAQRRVGRAGGAGFDRGLHAAVIRHVEQDARRAPGSAEDLAAAGELIDVDSVTGGYNLQVAWSTGYLAGISVY